MKKLVKLNLLLFVIGALILSGCTRTVDVGQYGPFYIGESKPSVLDKILKMNIKPAPIKYKKLFIDKPSQKDLQKLDNDDGILVWLDKLPFPLRIVLDRNLVVKTWGSREKCIASVEKMNIACNEIRRLDNTINVGMSREDVYKSLLRFDTKLLMQVGNFVVGYQEYRTGKNTSKNGYNALLLSKNAWTFTGLKELLWFGQFYSKVTVVFKDDKLVKIEHWGFPFELP